MSIKARFQLKNDTETNWNKAINFVPLKGEVIVYSADDTHPFSRIKVGDGVTTVINLPFIDASTLDGKTKDELIPSKLDHKLTFGAGQQYMFDGSEDVTVPVYLGTYRE